MNGMRYDGEHATRRRLMTRKNGSFSSSSILLCFLLFSPAAQNEIPDSGRSRDRLRRHTHTHTHGPNVSQKKRNECVPATPLQVFIIETYICERPSIRLKLIFLSAFVSPPICRLPSRPAAADPANERRR